MQVRRLSALIVGCLGVGMSYVVNAFNVFSLALKRRFEISQIELELVLALMFLGLCASLPGGLVLDRYGAKYASLLALVVSVTGYLLCWSALLNPVFYHSHFYLIAIYFFIAGVGGGLTYMASTASNVRNFPERRRGTVVGVLHAFLSAGPAIIMVIYNECFNGMEIDAEKHDLNGFFLFLVLSFGVINLLGVAVYGHYPPDVNDEHAVLVTEASIDNSYIKDIEASGDIVVQPPYDSINDVPDTSVRERSGVQDLQLSNAEHELLVSSVASGFLISRDHSEITKSTTLPDFLTIDYHLVFWPFIVLTALQMVFVQNLTIILESFKEEKYIVIFCYLTPILGTFAKPLIGLASDVGQRYVSRTSFVIFGCLIDVLCLVLSIFTLQYISVVLVTTTLVDIAAYVVYAVGPAIIIERFGLAAFSRNWGLVMAGFAVTTGAFLGLFGALYDSHMEKDADVCIGQDCYEVTLIVMAVTSIISTILGILYYFRYRRPATDVIKT